MTNGRIGVRLASLYELLAHMITLYEAAHGGNACWHEAEYYGVLSRRRSMAYSRPLISRAREGII